MKLTPEKLAAFCAALAETGNVTKACEAIDVSRQTAYGWRQDDDVFAADWDRAMQAAVLGMEDEARRRAFDGVEEEVHYKGDYSHTIRKYSDTLAIFLLKAHAPEKYREHTRLDLGNADDKPFEIADTQRASRLAGLVALANQRKERDADDEQTDDGSDLC